MSANGREALTGSIEGAASGHPRPDQVEVTRMQVGECFDPAPETPIESFDFYSEEAEVVDCGEPHRGFVFGRAQLDELGAGTSYPGDDTVWEAATGRCDAAFDEMFGAESVEVGYLPLHAYSSTWPEGDRLVVCIITDERGLPPVLDFGNLSRMLDLPADTCYDTPLGIGQADPGRSSAWVEVIECGDGSRGGRVFGRGELDPGPYPGFDQVNEMVGQRCSDIAVRDGVGPIPADYINFGFTMEENWNAPGTTPQFVCHVDYLFEPPDAG